MVSIKRWIPLGTAIAIIAVIILVTQATIAPDPSASVVPSADNPALENNPDGKSEGTPAAEFTGITRWLNSQPLSLQALQGKVVLVDFWTYSCINCLRTLPYLRDWNEKYASQGLVIVGMHSPEFDFEKDEANVREAIVRERVTWPVAMDNDFATWKAYQNRWWPHKFLIDQNGQSRYHHIGEGAYRETELKIRELLAEAGHDVSDIPVGVVNAKDAPNRSITRELYAGLGWSDGYYLGNIPTFDGDGTAVYSDPGRHEDGRFYLQGTWSTDLESVRHGMATGELEDYVAIRYTAAAVNVVVQPEEPEDFIVVATLNDNPIPEWDRGTDIRVNDEGSTYFLVDTPRLYSVVKSGVVNTFELELHVDSTNFVLYTFTFG